MRVRVADRIEEHSEDHLVNRCGSYMPFPPLPTYHEHSWLQMTQVPSANRLFGATHISHRFLIKRYTAFEWP